MLTMKKEQDADLMVLKVMADRILSIEKNVLSFALGGAVEIGVEVSEDRWRVAVKDHGPGVSAELLPHIFDRFRTNREGGTGLGLSIAQNIARRHDIVLEADSAEGEGATFAFRGHMTGMRGNDYEA